MKKYISLVIVMAAIAFLSVSYLAQAQTPAVNAKQPSAPVAAMPAPGVLPPVKSPVTGAATTSLAPVTYTKDRAECDTLASAPSTEGASASEASKEVIIKKCLASKGHTADEITKFEATSSATPASTPAAH